MNTPMQTALALSTTSTYASARRDYDVRRQLSGRSSGLRRSFGRHRRAASPPPL